MQGRIWRSHSVPSLLVFGSIAHGETSQGTGLHLVVQFEDIPTAEYATHFPGLPQELQDTMETEVDPLTVILVRENRIEQGGGLVLGIAGNNHPTLQPPPLHIR